MLLAINDKVQLKILMILNNIELYSSLLNKTEKIISTLFNPVNSWIKILCLILINKFLAKIFLVHYSLFRITK
jgi:uncharacterized protein involved in cysteine biosynthesis